MADDYTSSTSTTGVLIPGGKVSGTYETSQDSDWFKITLTAGNHYRFELSSNNAQSPAYYQGLALYDSNGSHVSYLNTSDANAVLYGAYKASTTGTYYIAASDRAYNSTMLGAYTLKASAALGDDAGDTIATAKAIVVGQNVQGTFESMVDVDRYKVTLEAGTTYTFTPKWTTDSSSGYVSNSLRMEKANGDYIASSNSYNNDGKLTFTTTTAGDYYLAASADSRARTASTPYTLTSAKAVDDYVASPATSGTLFAGLTLNGNLETQHDRDWFAVPLAASSTYWFTLTGAGGTNGSLSYNATVRLFDGSGKELGSTSASYSNVAKIILPYSPATSDTYYLEVTDTGGYTGKYTIAAAFGTPDDYTANPAQATAVAVNNQWSGSLEVPQDRDTVKIAVTSGKTYLFDVKTVSVKDTPVLNLSGAKTADGYGSYYLADYDKPGSADYKVLKADYTGDFYLTVYNDARTGTAGYTVNVMEAPADDHANDISTTSIVPIDGKVTGALDYTADVDWFKVTLQYGAKYAFMLRGAGSGEGTLVVGDNGAALTIRSAGSEYLYSNLQSWGAGNYTLKTETGGDYYIGISKSTSGYSYGNAQNDGTGTYTLSALALSSDFTAPKVGKITSSSGAQPLSLVEDIYVTFDEPVIITNGSIRLRNALGESVESFYVSSSSLQSNGTVLKLNPYSYLKPGAKYFVEFAADALSDLAGNKYSGTSLVPFNTVPALDKGGNGNDYLIGLSASTNLDGGAGTDTVVYANGRYGYTIGHSATETRVYSNGNPATADVLTGVERLLFSDSAVALDTGGIGGQAYRLYQGAFNRAPDKTGLGYWIAQMDKGASLNDVAQSFINSSEFITLNGAAPSDNAFVSKLYENVLHRAGEQAGIDYWSGVLAAGAPRSAVLASFSESPENQAAVLKVIGNGFEYTPYG